MITMETETKKLKAQEIVDLNRQYVFFSWSVQSMINPIPIERAEGVYFWDYEGKRYIDFLSQVMNVNTGLQHPKVVQAIKDQAEKLCFVSPSTATDVKGKLGRLLAEITPGNLRKTFFTLGGAESNENAIKFARVYTGRNIILARFRSYHGATHGAMALSGGPRARMLPGIPDVTRILDPFCYRCPFGWTFETCHRECISHVEEVIKHEGPENVAALFLEGVTGSNGIIIYPDEYLPRIREITKKYGILLVDDEVMSGFGRTGEWFAVNHWGVVPDIMTMAKGLTAAFVPMGAVIVSDEIANYFDDQMFPMTLTYSGHTLACATAIATINVYIEEKLVENSKAMGKILGEELEILKEKHPSVGDVRYIGLFSVIELVKNRETKEPVTDTIAPSGIMADISKYLRDNGLYTLVLQNYIFIIPALCITKSQIKEGMEIVDKALDISDKLAS
jgi:taurine--2-oxoglutarate transaminase